MHTYFLICIVIIGAQQANGMVRSPTSLRALVNCKSQLDIWRSAAAILTARSIRAALLYVASVGTCHVPDTTSTKNGTHNCASSLLSEA